MHGDCIPGEPAWRVPILMKDANVTLDATWRSMRGMLDRCGCNLVPSRRRGDNVETSVPIDCPDSPVPASRCQLVAELQRLKAVRWGDADPATSHPLISLPNALCTPHIGYVERDNYERYFGIAFDNIDAFAQGRPQKLVNPEVPAQPATPGTTS